MATLTRLSDLALDHYSSRQKLSLAAEEVAGQMWSDVDPRNIVESWAKQVPELTAVVTGAQLGAARPAASYTDEALQAEDVEPGAVADPDPAGFTGHAADGRGLMSLLTNPVFVTLASIQDGFDILNAMSHGRSALQMAVATEVADAGRLADQVAITSRRGAHGYIRMAVGNSCARCLLLAGREYTWSAGFQRHPKCLPAGVVVSGPATRAATRRWYEGELAVIATARGQQLPVTGNHPVLTTRGWLPAHLLQEGDYVVRSCGSQGANALVVPDEDQMPTRIEDLWRSVGMGPLLQMPTATEDFHGDGRNGEVDIVFADRPLWNWLEPMERQPAGHAVFSRRLTTASLVGQGAGNQMLVGLLGAANGGIGGGSLALAFVGGHASGAGASGVGPTSQGHLFGDEISPYNRSADQVAITETVFTFAGEVSRRDFLAGKHPYSSRWDAPASPFSMESAGAYVEIGQDLLLRLAGQVALDRVVENRRVGWSGHVYNLTSSEGWYSANGLIVSNCDCIHIPSGIGKAGLRSLMPDPEAMYARMTAAERTRAGFTLADQRAIADGADLNQVVNAHRGMYVSGGRKLTNESTTRRGVVKRKQRLSVDECYRVAAGDRDEALALLRDNGYLFDGGPRVVDKAIDLPSTVHVDPALKMTVADLKTIARQNNVPIGGLTKKQDIVDRLREYEAGNGRIGALPEFTPKPTGPAPVVVRPIQAPAKGGVVTGQGSNGWQDLVPAQVPADGLRARNLEIFPSGSDRSYIVRDGTIWRDPDGVTYLVEHGADEYGSEKVARVLAEIRQAHVGIPAAGRANKSYAYLQREDPYEGHWRVKYKNPKHESSMSASEGRIIMWRREKWPRVNMAEVRHETGHNLDTLVGRRTHGSGSKAWSSAAEADAKSAARIEEFDSGRRLTPGVDSSRDWPAGVTDYGKSSAAEDYAESVMMYQLGPIARGRMPGETGVRDLYFRDIFPERAKILDREFPEIAADQQAAIRALRSESASTPVRIDRTKSPADILAQEEAAKTAALAGPPVKLEELVGRSPGGKSAKALKYYQRHGDEDMNSLLRRGQMRRGATRSEEQVRAAIAEIDRLMGQSQLDEAIVVYRGVSSPSKLFPRYRTRNLTGTEFTDAGFVSTSASRQSAQQFLAGETMATDGILIEIRVPRGTPAIQVSNDTFIGASPSVTTEHEILLQRGLRYRVISDEVVPDVYRRYGGEVIADASELSRYRHIVAEIVPAGAPALEVATATKAVKGVEQAGLTRDVDAVLSARTVQSAASRREAFDVSTGEGSDVVLEAIAKEQRFDLPPRQVEPAELDRLIASGQPEIFRGVSNPSAEARFREGQYFGGIGHDGHGIYGQIQLTEAEIRREAKAFVLGAKAADTPEHLLAADELASIQRQVDRIRSRTLETVQRYAGPNGQVSRMTLAPDTEILDVRRDLYPAQRAYLADLDRRIAAESDPLKREVLERQRLVARDVGRFAAARGVRAYHGSIPGEIVILDRGALVVGPKIPTAAKLAPEQELKNLLAGKGSAPKILTTGPAAEGYAKATVEEMRVLAGDRFGHIGPVSPRATREQLLAALRSQTGIDENIVKREAARLLQLRVDRGSALADVLAEAAEMVGKKATPEVAQRAIQAMARQVASGRTPVPDAFVQSVVRAISDRSKAEAALKRLAQKYKIRLDAMAGDVTKFREGMEATGSALKEGVEVRITRPGAMLQLPNGDIQRLRTTVVREVDAAERARIRQEAIDAVRARAEALGEINELVANGASPTVLRERLAIRLKRVGLEADPDLKAFIKAVESGDPAKIAKASTAAAKKLGLTQVDEAGGLAKFDRTRFDSIAGSQIADGAQVRVVRPGFEATIRGEKVRLSKPVVEELSPAEVAQLRQQAIDSAKSLAELVGEAVGGPAQRRIAIEAAQLPDDIKAALLAASRVSPAKLKTTLTAQMKKLGVTTGKAPKTPVKFDPKLYDVKGGAKLKPGESVRVVQPEITMVRDGETIVVRKAVVESALPSRGAKSLKALLDPAMTDVQVEKAIARGIDGQYGPYKATVSDITRYRTGTIEVSGTVTSGSRHVGKFQRTFMLDSNGDLVAVHDLLQLSRAAQGSGFAAEFNANLYDWYRRSGFKAVKLHANIDVGGYAWATQGFDFADRYIRQEFIDRAEAFAHLLAQPVTDRAFKALFKHQGALGSFTQQEFRDQLPLLLDVIRRAQAGEEITAYELSQIGRKPGQGRDDRWLGKVLMLGTDWEGIKLL